MYVYIYLDCYIRDSIHSILYTIQCIVSLVPRRDADRRKSMKVSSPCQINSCLPKLKGLGFRG